MLVAAAHHGSLLVDAVHRVDRDHQGGFDQLGGLPGGVGIPAFNAVAVVENPADRDHMDDEDDEQGPADADVRHILLEVVG